MKEAFEKIKERLEETAEEYETEASKELLQCGHSSYYEFVDGQKEGFFEALSIVSEVEAEYINKSTEHINKSSDCSTNWIDVKDRLPEKDGYYLTCDHKGNIHVFFHSQKYMEIDYAFGIGKNHSQFYQPIAWMELPKPYTRKKGV